VVDFAAQRTRTKQFLGPALERLVRATEERWPWLQDGSEPDRGASVMVYAGTASYFASGDRWTPVADGTPEARQRTPADPAWIVEALCRAQVMSSPNGESGEVRGEPCERHRFEVQLARRRDALQLPPHRGSTPPRLVGEAWLDAHGRLRRVTWRRKTYSRRPRWPGEPSRTTGSVELWDFGVVATIAVPQLPRRLPGAGIVDIASVWRQLSRQRREYAESGAAADGTQDATRGAG
jgi:hypothetical protein